MQKAILKVPVIGKKNDNFLRPSPSKKDSSRSTTAFKIGTILSPSASSEAILPDKEDTDGDNETNRNVSVKKKS
jgi:hypothetical protein